MQSFKSKCKVAQVYFQIAVQVVRGYFDYLLADLTVSKRPGTSNTIKIHFAVFNHLYLCFFFMKLVETLRLCLIKRIINLRRIINLKRNLVVLFEKWISI